MTTATLNATMWHMPADGPTARAALIGLIKTATRIRLIGYAFDMTDLTAALIAAKQRGATIDVFLDHSQSMRHVQALAISQLMNAGISVTIGTSPAGTKYICHSKTLYVVGPNATAAPTCWEGSTNFSESAWLEDNTAITFASTEYAAQIDTAFAALINAAHAQTPAGLIAANKAA